MPAKKKRQKKQPKQKTSPKTYKRPNKLEKMSRLSFALFFIVPFIFGEILLYTGGRVASMYIFPFVWVGFWAALLYTNDWSPLIQRKDQSGEAADSSVSSQE